jgi:hypothetical protein
LTDYLIENEMDKISFVGKFNEKTDYKIIVNDIRLTLGLTEEWAK